MLLGLLNFGEGDLALHYLIFCTFGALGVIQIAAARSRLVAMLVLSPEWSGWAGIVVLSVAYAWFFTTQPDLFIPGLAGGELSSLSVMGFILALLICLCLGFISQSLFGRPRARSPFRMERIARGGKFQAELWLPRAPASSLVLALREMSQDGMNVLAGQLVARGAAVLVCREGRADDALEWLRENAERFNSSRRYVIGLGRGANRALALAANNPEIFHRVLALAPLMSPDDYRAGLRWLRETDFFTASWNTWRRFKIPELARPDGALVICGDEDQLTPPATARNAFPGLVVVAGARHFTCAWTRATVDLVAEWFDLRATLALAVTKSGQPSRALGELGE